MSPSLHFSSKNRNIPLLHIENMRKRLQKADNQFTLNIPKLLIHPGEFVAIVGESGCGKSTLLDLLALISAPAEGAFYEVNFSLRQHFNILKLWQQNQDDILASIRQKYLGYILQTGGLLPYLSIEENLSLPLKIKKSVIAPYDIDAMAQRMGVGDCLSRLPSALSGGQRQRVAILRALIHQPSLVLADEPTAAVDKQRAISIVDDFYHLSKEKGLAIFMVTHDIDLIHKIADKIYTFRLEDTGRNSVTSTLYLKKQP